MSERTTQNAFEVLAARVQPLVYAHTPAVGHALQRSTRRLRSHIQNDSTSIHQEIYLRWWLHRQLLEGSAVSVRPRTQLGKRSRNHYGGIANGWSGLGGEGLFRLDRLA
jgi:hypothetical protein